LPYLERRDTASETAKAAGGALSLDQAPQIGQSQLPGTDSNILDLRRNLWGLFSHLRECSRSHLATRQAFARWTLAIPFGSGLALPLESLDGPPVAKPAVSLFSGTWALDFI